jgi:lipopolysaccharide export LptBFGC system permease protein LptF
MSLLATAVVAIISAIIGGAIFSIINKVLYKNKEVTAQIVQEEQILVRDLVNEYHIRSIGKIERIEKLIEKKRNQKEELSKVKSVDNKILQRIEEDINALQDLLKLLKGSDDSKNRKDAFDNYLQKSLDEIKNPKPSDHAKKMADLAAAKEGDSNTKEGS